MFGYYPQNHFSTFDTSPYLRSRTGYPASLRGPMYRRPDPYASPYFDPADFDSDEYYLTPRQRAYLEAQRRNELIERERERLCLQAAQEERQRRQAVAEEMLRRRRMEALERQMRAQGGYGFSPFWSPEPSMQEQPVRMQAYGQDEDDESQSEPAYRPVSPTLPISTQSPKSTPAASTNAIPTLTPEEAATTIQRAYRTHSALRKISSFAAQFDQLRNSFHWPAIIDFELGPDNIVAVPFDADSVPTPSSPLPISDDPLPMSDDPLNISDAQPRLAYTPTNAPIHQYAEQLARLLTRLDGVESFGVREVRERRKAVVRGVESEASRVEGVWRGVWERHVRRDALKPEEKVEEPSSSGDVAMDDAPLPPAPEREGMHSKTTADATAPPVAPEDGADTSVDPTEDASTISDAYSDAESELDVESALDSDSGYESAKSRSTESVAVVDHLPNSTSPDHPLQPSASSGDADSGQFDGREDDFVML